MALRHCCTVLRVTELVMSTVGVLVYGLVTVS